MNLIFPQRSSLENTERNCLELSATNESIVQENKEITIQLDTFSTNLDSERAELSRIRLERESERTLSDSTLLELEAERDDLLVKVDGAVQQIIALKKETVDVTEIGIETDSCNESVFECLSLKCDQAIMERDLLEAKLDNLSEKLSDVTEENRNLLQSNHKQKLQVRKHRSNAPVHGKSQGRL